MFSITPNALISSNLCPRRRVITTLKQLFMERFFLFFLFLNFPFCQQGPNLLHRDTPAVMCLSHAIVMMTCHRVKMLCCNILYQSNKVSRDEPSLYSNAMLLQAIVAVISYWHRMLSSPTADSWSRAKCHKDHQV